MLKRNLIIIAIAALSLALTSNAFGQEKNRKTKVKKPSGATVQGGIFPSNTKANQPPTSNSNSQRTTGRRQNTPILVGEENVDPDKVKINKTQNKPPTQSNGVIIEPTFEPKIKTTRPSAIKPTTSDMEEESSERRKQKNNNYIGETEKNATKTQTRTRQTNQTNNVAPIKPLVTVPTDYPNMKTKKPSTFTGGTDDGQSIKRKQPRNKSINQPQNAVPTNQSPNVKPKTKKPVKRFTGGGEDGQSI